MRHLREIFRWAKWTVTAGRHRADSLAAERPAWTADELAQLPHVRHPEQRLKDEDAADQDERSRP